MKIYKVFKVVNYSRCLQLTAKYSIHYWGFFFILGNGWLHDAGYIPPFHIAADGHGHLGARFVDVNGDGAADLVFHRYIDSSTIQKGAYLGEYTVNISILY